MSALLRKARTARRLLVSGEFREFMRSLCYLFFRHFCYRVDFIDVSRFIPVPVTGTENYDFVRVSKGTMSKIFSEWPDSDEELLRHRQVYEEYGFENCFILVERDSSRVACLQFLLMFDDVIRGKRHLAWPMYEQFSSVVTAWQQWIYVFYDFRRKNLSVDATNRLVHLCRELGVERLYSSRGMTNHASLGMADKIGFKPIALSHHFQFFGQTGVRGLHILLQLRNSPVSY